MPRICVITHAYYPVDARARRMAEALVDAGYAVDVLCLRSPGQLPEEVIHGVRAFRLPVARHPGSGIPGYMREYLAFFVRAALRLYGLHRQDPYALVQVHSPPDPLVFCTVPLKLTGVPVLLDLSELVPELFMSRFQVGRTHPMVRLLAWLERLACLYADAVLILHERHRRVVVGRGAPAGKLTQVMNCPDERLFASDGDRGPLRRDGRFNVIYHGGIFRRYGLDLLVEAVAKVRSRIPEIRLELYGDGDFLGQVEAKVAGLGLGDLVRFHGRRPLDEMREAILAADVGVVPMRQDVFTDCVMPTKLLEYVALGVPVIAAATATVADYFDADMIQLFTPGDPEELAEKLAYLHDHPAAAQAQAARARSFTAAHNWRNEKDAYLAVIARLTGEKS